MRLSRYLFDPKHFAATKGRVKWKAFLPKTGEKNLSVFNTESLKESENWELSRKYVEPLRAKPTLARGDLRSSELDAHGLDLESDETPPRHRNICGFPELKEDREFVAKDLADAANLVLKAPK